jgi:hypothetical protein
MAFIRDSAHEIFEPLNDGTRMAFAGSVEQVQIELLGGIKRILREIRLLFIGKILQKQLSDALIYCQDSKPMTWRASLWWKQFCTTMRTVFFV